jgi:glycerol-3-phosphate dehydrogenase
VVFYYTQNASTTVNVRVRNTTDSTNAGAIAGASAATTVTREVITALTLASGIKTYRLEVTGSDALNGVYCWGYLRLRKVPA